MSTSKGTNPLENWYENRIGSPSTADEVYGYWVFVLGIVAGFVGIAFVMLSNSPGETIRGVGIALAALGLILLLMGEVIRLPLKTRAMMMSYIGAAIGTLAAAWFVVAFNAGNWSATFANSETLVIGLYALGIFVIATGSVVTPLLTGSNKEQQAAEERAGEAEATRDAAMREIERQEEHDEQKASEAEQQAHVTELERIKESQSQFELYADQGDQYRWRLRHDNDNIIADSAQGYASKASRDDGLESIRHYAQSADYLHIDPTAFELYRDEGGKYRWRLLHENGNILADSGQGYASRQGARQGVGSVQRTIGADGNAEFEVYEDSAGEYRFRLVHDNENILADSGQGYASESSAYDAVDHIRGYVPEAHVLEIGSATFEIYEDEGGDWRWRLRHRNGNIMADGSQGYASRTGAEDGLNSVKQNAPEAEVEAVDS